MDNIEKISQKKYGISRKLSNILTHGGLLFFMVIQLFPLYWLITFSFKNNVEIFAGNVLGLPETLKFDNYQAALSNGDVMRYLLNSTFITAVVIVVTCILSAMAAYGITRMRWKLSRPVLILFLLGIMVPLHAVLLPLFIVLNTVKLIDTYWALLIPYTAFSFPMAIFIFNGFLESIPKEMEEAALIDGCNIYQTFFMIIMSLLKPAMATVAIFTFLKTWNELMFATTFINSRVYRTLTVGIMSFTSQYKTDWGAIGASLLIAALPAILIYVILSKQVQDSIRSGGLKG